ncbi:TonB-dependent receptor [Halobacteriovorax sp. XZX-3]|uniref:TonB-dependent receptor n=1 Tax=unclassified Halobacteriovorax TaxID=2639665 RepID=UPI00372246D7
MDFCQILSAKQKALQINLDNKIYGSFAEIGAGQEVAREFFRAGGAAGTVAKTMSAYDMQISDAIYGVETSGRYVSQGRLHTMLETEFTKMYKRLKDQREEGTKFFCFADTVAAKSYSGRGECHGWLGVRFQHQAGAAPSDLIIHVNMLDQENLQQQEAIGFLGVNMIHSCFYNSNDSSHLVSSLMDNLSASRLKIDMIDVKGPAFDGVDPRILSLELVKRKFTSAVMFDENGKVVQIKDYLYRKPLVVLRGSFRPPTKGNVDALKVGRELLCTSEKCENVVTLSEISMSKLLSRSSSIDNADFLARVDLLAKIKQKVLITNFASYFELNQFLQPIAKNQIAFITNTYNLNEILNIKHYEDTSFGILGGLGELFGLNTKLYLYPCADDNDAKNRLSFADVTYDKSLEFLVKYLRENKLIVDLEGYDHEASGIWSRTVIEMISSGESGWEKMLPEEVVELVKSNNLFKN